MDHAACAEQVYGRLRRKLRRAADTVYGEELDDRDARGVIESSVWYYGATHPDCTDEEAVEGVISLMEHGFSSELTALRDARRRRRGSVKIARATANQLPALPGSRRNAYEGKLRSAGGSGTFFDGAAANNPIRVVEPAANSEWDPYEHAIGGIDVEGCLAELIKKWKDPDLALAYVLHHALQWSIPDILKTFGYSKEEVGATEWQRLRSTMWRRLKECRKHAQYALDELAKDVRPFFGTS